MKKYSNQLVEIISRFFQKVNNGGFEVKAVPLYVRTSDRQEKPGRPLH